MIESNGSLPHSVYWRRRVFAAGASVLAVVLLAWIIGGLVEADDQHPVRGTAGSSNLAATSQRSSVPPSARPAGSPGSTATQRATSAAATPRPGQPSVTPGPPTTQPPPPKPTTKVAAPGPPQPCPDAVVKVTARPDQPSYRVGERPLLSLELINVGPAPCTRDVSRKLREIVITSPDGASRLWSSNDCYGPPEQDVRTMAPNQPLRFTLNWAGRTSAPGCPVDRQSVPAGSYLVVGRLGTLTGASAPLTLTP